MADETTPDWQGNYFNYFTEVEEHFQRARGTALFLMSPLDWALIESWRNSGVPLEAVLRGIDTAFEKWHAQKKRRQNVNSLAYCTQAVMEEADRMAGLTPARRAPQAAEAPFSEEELRNHFVGNAALLRAHSGFGEIAMALDRLAADVPTQMADLEQLEQRLTALDDKLLALLRSQADDEVLFQLRRDLDQQLKPYRGKMTADQLALLERQFLDRKLLDRLGLKRLSLFYLGSG
jgi:hypothetical protein